MGVRSGYDQADVTEFSRTLTGWGTVGIGPYSQGDPDGTGFVFRTALHEPGARTIMNNVYPAGGEVQGRSALKDFAGTEATASHVSAKLARHFVGDAPSPSLVERLAKTFRTSGGDLPALYKTLIDSREAWAPQPVKFKTPWDWTISALRALGRQEVGQMQMASVLTQLGQPVWKPGSPAGWDDTAASWAAPDALLRRVEFAQRLAAPVGDGLDARSLGPRLIPASFNTTTAQQIDRAESPADALALLLVSPDFLRR